MHPAVEAAAAVDVVGRDPQIDEAMSRRPGAMHDHTSCLGHMATFGTLLITNSTAA